MMTALKAVLEVGDVGRVCGRVRRGGERRAVSEQLVRPRIRGDHDGEWRDLQGRCAHGGPSQPVPFGAKLFVTYGERQTVMGVTDRGPYTGYRAWISPRRQRKSG
jgi:hypothetical protein